MKEFEAKDLAECVRKLADVVEKMGPGWKVSPFGSVANGFLTSGSDLDVTCFHEDINEQDSSKAIKELQTKLLPMLQRHPRFEIIEEVWSARVPILKLIFDGKTEVDLSCHNLQALQNSALLKAYCNLHPLIRDLVILIKVWAKSDNVAGASEQHLSSYSWTLMTLYFLQVDAALQMPCLPTSAFGSTGTVDAGIPHTWTCQLSLWALFHRFFSFFVNEFQWGTEVISVRLGKREVIGSPSFQSLPGNTLQRIHLEDPFLRNRNLNCVLGHAQEHLLRARLQQALRSLAGGALPESFLKVLHKAEDEGSSGHSGNSHLAQSQGWQREEGQLTQRELQMLEQTNHFGNHQEIGRLHNFQGLQQNLQEIQRMQKLEVEATQAQEQEECLQQSEQLLLRMLHEQWEIKKHQELNLQGPRQQHNNTQGMPRRQNGYLPNGDATAVPAPYLADSPGMGQRMAWRTSSSEATAAEARRQGPPQPGHYGNGSSEAGWHDGGHVDAHDLVNTPCPAGSSSPTSKKIGACMRDSEEIEHSSPEGLDSMVASAWQTQTWCDLLHQSEAWPQENATEDGSFSVGGDQQLSSYFLGRAVPGRVRRPSPPCLPPSAWSDISEPEPDLDGVIRFIL